MKVADKIYQTLTIGIIQARKTLKGDIHNNPWSIELSYRSKYLSYWGLVVSQLQTKTSYIRHL